jgi:HSP20 family protein
MALTDLIPWNRNRDMPAPRQADPFVSLRREMDRVFDDFFRGFDLPMTRNGFDLPMTRNGGWSVGTWPHVEVSETDSEVKLVAELPGMEEKDIELNFHDGMLTLNGEKKHETKDAVYSERWHGQFQRSFQLGPDVDLEKIKAEFKNGVLTITAGKRPEAQRQVKRIPLNSASA